MQKPISEIARELCGVFRETNGHVGDAWIKVAECAQQLFTPTPSLLDKALADLEQIHRILAMKPSGVVINDTWLSLQRQRLFERVCTLLEGTLHLGDAEVDPVVRVGDRVRSRVDGHCGEVWSWGIISDCYICIALDEESGGQTIVVSLDSFASKWVIER